MRQDVARVRGARRIDSHSSFIDVLDEAVFIDDERGAISVAAFFVKYPVISDDCSFEIAQQRKSNAVLFGELAISRDAVHADSENLSVVTFEFGDISLIRLHFLRSTTGEGQHVEGQHDIFLALEIAQFVTH